MVERREGKKCEKVDKENKGEEALFRRDGGREMTET